LCAAIVQIYSGGPPIEQFEGCDGCVKFLTSILDLAFKNSDCVLSMD